MTAAASNDRIRFAALALTRHIQLQVLSTVGEVVYDSRRQPGNRLEWTTRDQGGAVLPDGLYGCLVTVADLHGRQSRSLAVLRVKDGAAAFYDRDTPDEPSDEHDSIVILKTGESSPFTIVSHDGTEGWIESAAGGLNFQAGSMSADSAPHLRLTPEGNLGVGVKEPRAKLDVAGLIRASEGIQFSDGTILKMDSGYPVLVSDSSSNEAPAGIELRGKTGSGNTAGKVTRVLSTVGAVTPVLASLGTTGRIAKFVSASDLGDSVLFESSGNVGIGTTTPSRLLEIRKDQNASTYLQLTNAADTADLSRSRLALVAGSVTQEMQSIAMDGGYFGTTSNHPFRIYTNKNTRMTVDTSGRVGIGTMNPTQRLEVAGNVKVTGTGNGIVFPDGSSLTSSLAARIRSVTYLAGCDSCSVLTDSDDQRTIFVNLTGAMTINSVTCFSDAGSPVINLQRDSGAVADILVGNLTCSPSGATSSSVVAAQGVLNLDDRLNFVMVTAGGVAKRVTVAIKATVN